MASNNVFRLPPPILGQVGIALIVANDYNGTSKRYLSGTVRDAHAMVNAFDFLGYHTIPMHNVTAVQFITECENLAAYDYSPSNKCKRIAVLFSGHGDIEGECRGVLIMQDEKKVLVKDVVNMFKATTNATLANTSRMFFIDACRGDLEEPRVVSRSPRGGTFIDQASSEAGILIAYSTTEHHKAYESEAGGFWIQYLAHEMRTLDKSLLSVLTEVNKKLNEQCNRSHSKLQTAQIVSQLIEDIYFLRERPVQPVAQDIPNGPPIPPDHVSTEQMESEESGGGIRETLTVHGITCQFHITETPSQQLFSRPCYSCELSCLSNGMNYKFRSRQSYHSRDDAKKDVTDQAMESPDIGAVFSSRSATEEPMETEDHTSRVDKLAEHCKSKGWRPPSYKTMRVTNGYTSTVMVPRNGKFEGESAESIEQAKEKAARKALLEMKIIVDSLKLL